MKKNYSTYCNSNWSFSNDSGFLCTNLKGVDGL